MVDTSRNLLGVKLYYQATEKETSLFRFTLSEMSNANKTNWISKHNLNESLRQHAA